MTLYERNDGLISKNEFEELSKVNFIDIPDEIKKFIGLHGDIDIHTISAVRVDGEYYSEDEFDGGKRQKRATEDILKYHGVTVYDLDKALLQEPRMFLEEGDTECEEGKAHPDRDCERCVFFFECLLEGREKDVV